jgi:hypothetical protein
MKACREGGRGYSKNEPTETRSQAGSTARKERASVAFSTLQENGSKDKGSRRGGGRRRW